MTIQERGTRFLLSELIKDSPDFYGVTFGVHTRKWTQKWMNFGALIILNAKAEYQGQS